MGSTIVQTLDFSASTVVNQPNLLLDRSTTAKKALLHKAWALKSSDTLTVDVKFPGSPAPVLIAVKMACIVDEVWHWLDHDSCPTVQATVDSNTNKPVLSTKSLPSKPSKIDPKYQTFYWQIEEKDYSAASATQTPTNHKITFEFGSSGSHAEVLFKSLTLHPSRLYSQKKQLDVTLYGQFAETTVVTGAKNNDIWTRAYGLADGIPMIPAPTFYFNPGDLVNVKLKNMLYPTDNPVLKKYDATAKTSEGAKGGDTDDTLINDSIRHEINIPHNLNNTNIHVHGLHVDPSKDDATIVITPTPHYDNTVDANNKTSSYDAPTSKKPTDDLTDLNEGSVSDQSVKKGGWEYFYRIPSNHLPGTHWYHPHKHGSTAAQVENGMAGSIVIQENKKNAVVPYPSTGKWATTNPGSSETAVDQTDYDRATWEHQHDRVLMIQEIANYGIQFGKGDGSGTEKSALQTATNVTVNGQNPYQLNLQPNQLERWRFINAGTNHRAFSHIWLGKDTGKKDSYVSKGKKGKKGPIVTPEIYTSASMYLVAIDGITLKQKQEITAAKPLLLGPGNRADVLVQLPDPGPGKTDKYAVFKYYPISVLSNSTGKPIYRPNPYTAVSKPLLAAQAHTSNPYLFANTGTAQPNFSGYKSSWIPAGGGAAKKESIFPLIRVKGVPSDKPEALAVDFSLSGGKAPTGVGKWQPTLAVAGTGGGGVDTATLMNISVSGSSVSNGPNMPTDAYLYTISPTGKMASTPDYVRHFKDQDILQSRPVIFDMSGVAITVDSVKKSIKQFTLNGRVFALNDPIGNSKANTKNLIGQGITASDIDKSDSKILDGLLTLGTSGNGNWTNQINGTWWWVNPSYYQGIKTSTAGYSYDAKGTPSWKTLTGIDKPALINPYMDSSFIASQVIQNNAINIDQDCSHIFGL